MSLFHMASSTFLQPVKNKKKKFRIHECLCFIEFIKRVEVKR